ncbi:MAG: nucleotide exchange factor GrpE [Candidatus Staskawiczbacteria bacterium]|nr:nucleotide exchange factor GrpE [Candidatus Staskawiczbacteria bacterium]
MTEENTINSENIQNLEEIQKKSEEYLNNWKRAVADMANYRKGEVERAGHLIKYAKEDIFLGILPILDSIGLAENHMPEEIKSNEWTKGFMQIKKQIEEFLKKEDIEEIKSVGDKFNPETMEAVSEANSEEQVESGTVVEELQKGYKIGDKLLRPARVRVTK